MKTHGLNIDADKIAAGLYKIICDKGEGAIVAFGMIPSWVMDSLHPMLKRKIVDLAAEQNGITGRELELMGVLDSAKITEIVREIERAVVSAIYKHAAQNGGMAV